MVDGIVRDEIGSEFWDIPIAEKDQLCFPSNTMWFISGTSALHYIIQDVVKHRRIKSAAIPSWCCSSMIEPFLKNGIEVFFYSIYVDETGVLTKNYTSTQACDITLVISYFGYSNQKTEGRPSGIIIRDVTHSLFCENTQDATYYFGSLRKWAGFWTGGYAWKDGEWEKTDKLQEAEASYITLRKKAMESKLLYLQGQNDDKTYLNVFEQGEEFLDCCGIISGTKRDIECALHFDIEMVKKTRRQNAQYLISELGEYALFSNLSEGDCPLFVPIILKRETRDGLRRYLIENRIYCPVHWGKTTIHRLTDSQMYLYDHELSIVCDQRYGLKEMQRIIEHVRNYLHSHY